jgi:hypothetical protein
MLPRNVARTRKASSPLPSVGHPCMCDGASSSRSYGTRVAGAVLACWKPKPTLRWQLRDNPAILSRVSAHFPQIRHGSTPKPQVCPTPNSRPPTRYSDMAWKRVRAPARRCQLSDDCTRVLAYGYKVCAFKHFKNWWFRLASVSTWPGTWRNL